MNESFSRHLLLNCRRLDARPAPRDPSPSLTHDAPEECVDGAGLAIDASRGVVTIRVEVDASSSHYVFFICLVLYSIGRRLYDSVDGVSGQKLCGRGLFYLAWCTRYVLCVSGYVCNDC